MSKEPWKEVDPFHDPYGKPYTDEQIRAMYEKFWNAYYKEQSRHAEDTRQVHRVLNLLERHFYKIAHLHLGNPYDRLVALFEVLREENHERRIAFVTLKALCRNRLFRFLFRKYIPKGW